MNKLSLNISKFDKLYKFRNVKLCGGPKQTDINENLSQKQSKRPWRRC
jgi:hypothetical protein